MTPDLWGHQRAGNVQDVMNEMVKIKIKAPGRTTRENTTKRNKHTKDHSPAVLFDQDVRALALSQDRTVVSPHYVLRLRAHRQARHEKVVYALWGRRLSSLALLRNNLAIETSVQALRVLLYAKTAVLGRYWHFKAKPGITPQRQPLMLIIDVSQPFISTIDVNLWWRQRAT